MKVAIDKCSRMISQATVDNIDIVLRYHWLLMRSYKQLPIDQQINITGRILEVQSDLNTMLALLGKKDTKGSEPVRFRIRMGTMRLPLAMMYVNNHLNIATLMTH